MYKISSGIWQRKNVGNRSTFAEVITNSSAVADKPARRAASRLTAKF